MTVSAPCRGAIFADQADGHPGRRGFNRRAQTRAARADDEDVVFKSFVRSSHGKIFGCDVERLEETEIVPDAHGAQANIDVGEADPEKAEPRPHHVTMIEAAHTIVALGAGRRLSIWNREIRRSGGGRNGNRTYKSRSKMTLIIRTSDPTATPEMLNPIGIGKTKGPAMRPTPECK